MAFRNFEERPKLAFYESGPGPAFYSIPVLIGRKHHAPTHRINPEYSMGIKLRSAFIPYSIGPGPAYLIPYGLKSNGWFVGYHYTIRQKFPFINKCIGPPPYELPPADVYKPKAPAFSFGSRTGIYNKRISPAPNTYLLPPMIGPKIPDRIAAAECTLKGDRKQRFIKMSPGAEYNIGPPDLVKLKAPAFTMRIRWRDLKSQMWPASPASYDAKLPPCPCKVKKGWHLGSRYNDFTGIFRTQCDKSRYEPLD